MENFDGLAIHEVKDLLVSTIKQAEDEFFDKGITQATHLKLKALMMEFDNHLTFSKI